MIGAWLWMTVFVAPFRLPSGSKGHRQFNLVRRTRIYRRNISMENSINAMEESPIQFHNQCGDWHKNKFSISIPFKVSPSNHYAITSAVKSRLSPLMAGYETGICLIQVLNKDTSIAVGSSDNVDKSRSISIFLSIADGNIHLESGLDIYLSSLSQEQSSGSDCFDFSCTWFGKETGELKLDESVNESNNSDEIIDMTGRHKVGQWRPADEWTAAREVALDAALELLGYSGKELRESDEFSGTSALKVYQTFVRPRPAKAAIHAYSNESIEKASERTSHQIGHLIRHHRADRATFLRNRDVTLQEYKDKGIKTHPIALILDNIRSAYNVGGIFRTADTASIAEVVTCGFTPNPSGSGADKLRKTAFTSLDTVRSRHFSSTLDAVRLLRSEGYRILAMETTSDAANIFTTDLFPEGNYPLKPLALILGHEVTGVDVSVIKECDGTVEIPVYGIKNSLNVCSAATAGLYEALRQYKLKEKNEINHSSGIDDGTLETSANQSNASRQSRGQIESQLQTHLMDLSQSTLLNRYASAHSEEESSLLSSLRQKTMDLYPDIAHMMSDHIQGRILKAITELSNAKRVLELGTFTGYSTLCFCEGGASVVTCDRDKRSLSVARECFLRSPYKDRIAVKEGNAKDLLEEMYQEECDPFDLIFIDCNKLDYMSYLDFIVEKNILKEGGILLVDNVLFKGIVADIWRRESTFDSGTSNCFEVLHRGISSSESGEESSINGDSKRNEKTTIRHEKIARSMHQFNKRLRNDHRFDTMILPVRDGLSVSILKQSNEVGTESL